MSDTQTFRRTLREQVRNARRAIPKKHRAAASAKICQTFSELDAFQSAQIVSGFLAFDGEADPLGLMIKAVELGKQVFVPIIIQKCQPLKFSPWRPDVAMKPNSFGIEEPDVPSSDWIAGDELDFVITPLVAFDKKCNRIGVGGGYYDRTFEFLNKGESRTTSMFGFAFELQRIDAIECQDWDVRLDGVVTEAGKYGC